MKKEILLLISALIFIYVSIFVIPLVEAQTYTVRPGHPRIYLTSDNLQEIRNRCATTHKEEYKTLKNYADSNFGIDPTTVSTETLNHRMLIYSFLYKMGTVPSINYTHSPDDYGSYAKSLLLEEANRELAAYQGRYWNPFVGTTYDWLYDVLTPEERAIVVQAIIHHVDIQIYNPPDFRTDMHAGAADIKDWFISGLAFYGDGINDAKAQEYTDGFQAEWVNYLIPANELQAADTGGWHEGLNYAGWRYRCSILAIDAWLTATGENYFKDSKFLKSYPYWLASVVHPIPVGSSYRYLKYSNDREDSAQTSYISVSLAGISSAYHELGDDDTAGLAEWLFQNRHHNIYYNSDYVFFILWRNKTIAPKSPAQLYQEGKLPLTQKFGNYGLVTMRTGFQDMNDSLISFLCRLYIYGAHDDFDGSSFTINKKGHLALDSGDYEWWNQYDFRYGRRTIAHNTVIIYNPSETFKGYPNDGGQRILIGEGDFPYHYTGYTSDSKWAAGGIKEFESLPGQYDYMLGDATRAYQSTLYSDGGNQPKISLFTRQFVYLRPQTPGANEFVVVFDRVNSTNASFPKRWLLHMSLEPAVNGNATPIISNH